MMRVASADKSGGTAMQTSMRPCALKGKIVDEAGPVEGMVSIPCVSSKPRTIDASISECVRKTTGQSTPASLLPFIHDAAADDGRHDGGVEQLTWRHVEDRLRQHDE